jgi:hypothetical protein
MEDWWKHVIAEILIASLFLWSEYLGITTKHKSNAIAQLLMCALTPKDPTQQEPPAIVVTPPASQQTLSFK